MKMLNGQDVLELNDLVREAVAKSMQKMELAINRGDAAAAMTALEQLKARSNLQTFARDQTEQRLTNLYYSALRETWKGNQGKAERVGAPKASKR